MDITVIEKGSEKKINCDTNENLLGALRSAGVSISAPCGGNGSCGKCKVKINCFTETTDAERKLLSPAELSANIRLACKTTVWDGMIAEIIGSGGKIATVDYESQMPKTACLREIADIGTTTVTVAQIDDEGKIISSVSENNAQSTFGADVMSRISAAVTDGSELQRLIIGQLKKITKCKDNCLVVVGNTTMLHLLLGRDCSGMGKSPFTPDFLDAQEETIDGLRIKTLPCLHSFIGADVTAGIIACHPSEKFKLLVDLGTNAEIALFNREKIFAVSAAAGPAFEGANIRCGMAAIPGAVCGFSLDNGIKNISTVNSEPPKGICGSGLLDIIAALLDESVIDESGYMECGEYKIAGSVVLCAKDVREFQLAKSAVRTGIEMLIEKSGVSTDDISEVLLAGGFGTFLNVGSAARAGLIPENLICKTKAAGNTALLGAAKYAAGFTELPLESKVFNLAALDGFNERFIENLIF